MYLPLPEVDARTRLDIGFDKAAQAMRNMIVALPVVALFVATFLMLGLRAR